MCATEIGTQLDTLSWNVIIVIKLIVYKQCYVLEFLADISTAKTRSNAVVDNNNITSISGFLELKLRV